MGLKVFNALAVLLALVIPNMSLARVTVSTGQAVEEVRFECVAQAAAQHQVPLAALVGILAVEGGTPGQAVSNTNGSWDMGPFQINSCWANKLNEAGISAFDVLNKGCLNAHVAAWILRQEMNRTQDIWAAIGAYHSPHPRRARTYADQVSAKLRSLNVDKLLEKVNHDATEQR